MPPNPPPSAEIARLRAQMDRLNARLATAIQARARLALTIAGKKARVGLPAADPARERAMLRAVLAAAPDGLPRRDLERIFRAIFDASRRLVVRARRVGRRGRAP